MDSDPTEEDHQTCWLAARLKECTWRGECVIPIILLIVLLFWPLSKLIR
jgi:hypothetical protein